MLHLLILFPIFMAGISYLVRSEFIRTTVFFITSLMHLFIVTGFWVKIPPPGWAGFIALDALSLLVLTIISILFTSVSVYLFGYFKDLNRSNRIMIVCLLFFMSSMTLVVVSQHLGLLWVAVEATTLSVAALINYNRHQKGLEATWKYLVISSVGIALALMGTLFMAVSAINIETLMLKDLMNKASQLYPPWLKLSVIFLIAGYGTKMGLVPMHSWKPDTYGEVPGPVGALMSGAITSCAFLIIMRIGEVCHKAGLMDFFQSILLLLGMLSLFVSCVFILNQTSFNRMLGYSSIEHMGILVLGIGIGGIGIYGSIFHMINNAFAKGIMFLLAETLYRKYKTKNIFDNHGIIHTYPYLGVFLLTGFLYVTGFPPFGTFYSELIILKSAIVAKHYAVAFFYALFLAVIFIGLARIFLNMVFGVSIQKEPVILYKENITIILPVLFLLAISLVIGMHMPAFLENTMLTASSFLGE